MPGAVASTLLVVRPGSGVSKRSRLVPRLPSRLIFGVKGRQGLGTRLQKKLVRAIVPQLKVRSKIKGAKMLKVNEHASREKLIHM